MTSLFGQELKRPFEVINMPPERTKQLQLVFHLVGYEL